MPLERLITQAANRVAQNHPEFFDRLDDYANKSFVIVPTDLDWIAAIGFRNKRVQIRLSRSLDAFPNRDVTVTAPFLSLLDLIDGEEDGDALFFSRDLTIEGDTEAVLALRNTLDDAEIDFIYQCAQIAGPLSAPLEAGTKHVLNRLRGVQNKAAMQEDAPSAMHDMAGPYPT